MELEWGMLRYLWYGAYYAFGRLQWSFVGEC